MFFNEMSFPFLYKLEVNVVFWTVKKEKNVPRLGYFWLLLITSFGITSILLTSLLCLSSQNVLYLKNVVSLWLVITKLLQGKYLDLL